MIMRGSADRRGPDLVSFWLRAVRIGIVVTILTVIALAAALLLPGSEPLHTSGYLAVLVGGALGGTIVAILPWSRLFERGLGLLFLYAWSAADISLITIAIVASRGEVPELFLVYVLTTVFFGAAYPPRAQVGLLAFTLAAYLAVLATAGWEVNAVAAFLQLSVLCIVALLTYFLSSDLIRAMRASAAARADAERWARMLSTVADSARRMSLDLDSVLDATVAAARDLGFDAVAVHGLSPDGRSFRLIRSAGTDGGGPIAQATEDVPVAGSIVEPVTAAGSPVRIPPGDMAAVWPDGAWTGPSEGVAVPVWIGGWLGALLVAGVRDDAVPDQLVQALELLGAQLGLALDNVARFDEERRTVERMAELDRMKGDFLTTVSHELRTPVTVIKGVGLTLLRSWETLEPAVRTEMLAGLAKNAASLDGLIANLLDLSRLDAGGADVGFDVFDLSETLHRVADRFEARFTEHPLARTVPRGLIVEGEPTMIERVVENILSNAAIHTPPGTQVEVAAIPAQSRTVVSIRDGGPGIPDDALAHVGERFFRGGPINDRPKGLGLGLALAREMLELHGSELAVESQPGRGTAVSFALPALVSGPARARPPSVDPSPPSRRGRLAGARNRPDGRAGAA
jgi:K+-sensing histidine kinase KdpD